jgi:hypothetical protein
MNWPTKELSPTTNWPTKGEQLFLASLSTTDTEKSRQLPKKSEFLEKSDLSNRVPKLPKKSEFLEKSDLSNRVPKRAQ